MIFVGDFTKMMWVPFLKEKSEAFEKFKIFKNRVENEYGVKIKFLRSYRGGQFTSREFNMFCEENGIKRQLSSPRTPEQNGICNAPPGDPWNKDSIKPRFFFLQV